MEQHCQQVFSTTSQGFSKLYVVDSMRRDNAANAATDAAVRAVVTSSIGAE